MFDCRFHIQPLQLWLFAGHDHVHVMAAAQAMVSYGKQTIRVGRQIHAHHVSFLVDHVIDEPRVLMGETIVVLSPDVRSEQIVQRRNRTAPFDIARDL